MNSNWVTQCSASRVLISAKDGTRNADSLPGVEPCFWILVTPYIVSDLRQWSFFSHYAPVFQSIVQYPNSTHSPSFKDSTHKYICHKAPLYLQAEGMSVLAAATIQNCPSSNSEQPQPGKENPSKCISDVLPISCFFLQISFLFLSKNFWG